MRKALKLIWLVIGPIIFVGSIILNAVTVVQLGWPLWAYQASGAMIFAVALIGVVLQNQKQTSKQMVLSAPADPAAGQSPYSRPFTRGELAHIGTMSNNVMLSHGHSDLLGLMESVRKGKMLTDENCYECGKPRIGGGPFAKPENDVLNQIDEFIEEGANIRRRCLELSDPPPTALLDNWRRRICRFLESNFDTLYANEWDKEGINTFLGVNENAPSFTGIITPEHKSHWDGVQIRLLRLEELKKQLS